MTTLTQEMGLSFFDGKTAIAYRLLVVSFDDDFYYGQFYRAYKNEDPAKPAFKQFLCNFHMSLDNDEVEFTMDRDVEGQVYTDFGLDQDKPKYYLEEAIQRHLESMGELFPRLVFEMLKQKGGTYDEILLEGSN